MLNLPNILEIAEYLLIVIKKKVYKKTEAQAIRWFSN